MSNRSPIISSAPLTAPPSGIYTATVSNGGIIGTAGGMPVYGGGSTVSSSSTLSICSTAHVRFRAGEEQQDHRYKLMFQLSGASSLFSEVILSAIYWDIGVVPGGNPLAELVRAFEGDGDDDIHTEPMALFGAGVWSPCFSGVYGGPQVPLSYGLPPGPLPKTQWCRSGFTLTKPVAVTAGSSFHIEVGFTRKWAPSKDVDLSFTIQLA